MIYATFILPFFLVSFFWSWCFHSLDLIGISRLLPSQFIIQCSQWRCGAFLQHQQVDWTSVLMCSQISPGFFFPIIKCLCLFDCWTKCIWAVWQTPESCVFDGHSGVLWLTWVFFFFFFALQRFHFEMWMMKDRHQIWRLHTREHAPAPGVWFDSLLLPLDWKRKTSAGRRKARSTCSWGLGEIQRALSALNFWRLSWHLCQEWL